MAFNSTTSNPTLTNLITRLMNRITWKYSNHSKEHCDKESKEQMPQSLSDRGLDLDRQLGRQLP